MGGDRGRRGGCVADARAEAPCRRAALRVGHASRPVLRGGSRSERRTMPRLTLAPAAPPAPAATPLVRRAYAFAEHAHRGQRRKDGQAYISHPVRVARLLAERD